MNSIDIYKILKSDEFISPTFLGVFPSDMLPSNPHKTFSLVANEDPSNKPGSHWVAFYIKDGLCIYFDSYGRPPKLIKFIEFIGKNDLVYNSKRLQGSLSSACGQYCIYFLMHICRGFSMNDIVKAFDGHDDNDQAVVEFVNDYFDIKTPVMDLDFIIQQVCTAKNL